MRVRARLAATARGVLARGRALVTALAYRRQELLVVGLLTGGLLGGYALDAWHRREPALLDRLEAEPPRLPRVTSARPSRDSASRPPPEAPRPRDRVRAPGLPARLPGVPTSAAEPVDLDRASPADLMQLPGIGPRLAARILAHRVALGGHFGSFDEFAGVPGLGQRRAALLRPLVRVSGDTGAATAPPRSDPGPAAGPPAAAPREASSPSGGAPDGSSESDASAP